MLVAVYGSLRQGLHNHRLLENSEFIGTDRIPNWEMYSYGGFPFIAPSSTSDTILIEVYDVTEDEFASLDMLEGYPSFYNRKQVSTEYGDAWIYFIDYEDTNDFTPVPNGDWKAYYGATNDYSY